MEKGIFDKKIIALGVLGVAIVAYLTFFLPNKPTTDYKSLPASARLVIPSHEKQLVDEMQFSGENGVSALDSLKKIVPVEQDISGMVVSVNGRKADAKKHEYWAFYVNGKLANIGPKDYITKKTDTIQWKIDKY
jgi:hypothetical protein